MICWFTWLVDPIWLIWLISRKSDWGIILERKTFFEWSDQILWPEVLSIDLSDKYLIGPCQSSVIWSFRYVMTKHCQLIFQTNTWLAWVNVLSSDLSNKDMIVNKCLKFLATLALIKIDGTSPHKIQYYIFPDPLPLLGWCYI